jgi:hypothetical protein
VLRWIIKIKSSPFSLLIINFKILSKFQRSGAHLVEKRTFEKKPRTIHSQGLSVLNMQKHFWFISSFKDVKFIINGKYSQKNNDNPDYYFSLVVFQTYENAILRNVHDSLGWLLWLWFYLVLSCFSKVGCLH